jgi:malate/lactate dehydrogenase
VGWTTAYALRLSGTPAEIVLVDRDERGAHGHVQDLRDAEVFSHTTRVAGGHSGDCCSADVVIITTGLAPGSLGFGEVSLSLPSVVTRDSVACVVSIPLNASP